MITRTPRNALFTFADFLELVQEDQKADLIEGVIHMASPESIEHNDLIAWLARLLGNFNELSPFGRITINRVAYHISKYEGPEPDIGIVLARNMGRLKSGYVDGPPDVAIEIVSPTSVERDYEKKRRQYEDAGTLEYWLLDAIEQRTTFLVRGESGFVEAALDAGRFASRVIPGFLLDTRWLWQRPLPNTIPLAQAMLAARA